MSVFEADRVVRADRAVSVRELARRAGALVGEIELNGCVVVISRYGKMVAAITPLPERTIVEFTGSGLSDSTYEEEPEPEARPAWDKLDDIQKALLKEALSAHPMPFGVGGMPFPASETAVALTRLELDGLIDRERGGKRLTRDGLAAAQWLGHD